MELILSRCKARYRDDIQDAKLPQIATIKWMELKHAITE